MTREIGASPLSFDQRAGKALADMELRGNLRRAMDGLMAKRLARFPDRDAFESLRGLGERVRQRALDRLPDLLERLEENCTRNGMRVHWAETTEEANEIVLGIMRARKAKTMVKGKSMVSEEMRLNAVLAENGMEALESDLGEYILQLAGEAPSHIVMPCVHMNRNRIADLLHREIEDARHTDNVEEMTAIVRRALRQKFKEADVGLSGVNMAVAETGTLLLVENEGNGLMSTTVPPVHIAVMGIEKVYEKLEHAAPVLTLLARSATGQPITTYVNMISGPRKRDELDGPEEVHLVLLDNGRSGVYADHLTRRTLRCIRCGACMNHCPVYTRIGGHAYDAVYPGPIGKILAPQLDGLEKRADFPSASSLCNACVEVCPVKIPIAEILVYMRGQAAARAGRGTVKGAVLESLIWRLWRISHANPGLYRLIGAMATTFGRMAPAGLYGAWTKSRTKPIPAKRSLHAMMRDGRSDR